MDRGQVITKNFSSLLIVNILAGALSFILNILLIKYLGDAEFGKYSFALSFVAIFAIFSHIGLWIVVIRDVARDRSQAAKYFGTTLLIEIALSLITLILIVVSINVFPKPDDTRIAVYIIGIACLIETFISLLNAVCAAFERMEYQALLLFLKNGIFFCLALAALISNYGLFEVVILYLLTDIIVLAIGYLIVRNKFVKPVFNLNPQFIKYLVISAIPFGMAGAVNLVYLNIDVVFLSIFKGDAVVGWYKAAYLLVSVIALISGSVTTAIFPSMSKEFVHSKEALRSIYVNILRYSFIFLIPLAIGTALTSEKIIQFLYGPDFQASSVILKILIWGGILSFINSLFYTTLGAINKQKHMVQIMTFGAVINVILNLLLIPSFSYIGAGIAILITQGVCFLLSNYIISLYLGKINMIKIIVMPTIASLFMAIAIYYIINFDLIILVIIASIIYFAASILLKNIDKDEMVSFIKTYSKR